MTLKEYVLYLREYAAHFGISELIRFNVKAAAGGATHFYVLAQSHRSAEVITVQKGCNTKDSYEVPLLCKRRHHESCFSSDFFAVVNWNNISDLFLP